MRTKILTLAAVAGLAACGADETVTQYGGADYLWRLTEIDGVPVGYSASMMFEDDGGIAGDGPCNGFTALQAKPYPWIEVTLDVVEQVYCPDIDKEEAFFAALQAMSLVEVSGPNMLLSNDAGRKMAFTGLRPQL